MVMSDQLHFPAALSPGKGPQYPLDRKQGETQGQSGNSGEQTNFSTLPAVEIIPKFASP